MNLRFQKVMAHHCIMIKHGHAVKGSERAENRAQREFAAGGPDLALAHASHAVSGASLQLPGDPQGELGVSDYLYNRFIILSIYCFCLLFPFSVKFQDFDTKL